MSNDIYYEGTILEKVSREGLEQAKKEYYNMLVDIEVEIRVRDNKLVVIG